MSADETDTTSEEFEALWAAGEEAVLVPPPNAAAAPPTEPDAADDTRTRPRAS